MAVLKHLNVTDHIPSRIAPSGIKHPGSSRPFGFQAVKKAPCNCIVTAIALSTHTANHAVGHQEPLIIVTGI